MPEKKWITRQVGAEHDLDYKIVQAASRREVKQKGANHFCRRAEEITAARYKRKAH